MSRYITLFVEVLLMVGCHGYGYGPPAGACKTMFPDGHDVDARTDDPPFTLSVNKTSYSPGDVIEVNITSHGNWFMEGIFVQARTLQCNHQTAIGSFQLKPGCPDFLQTMKCFDKKDSAIRHYNHLHVYNRTFYWRAPSGRAGHVYLRATVARNRVKFWMNVFSDFIRDPQDPNTNMTRCPVQMKYKRPPVCGAVHVRISVLLLLLTPICAWAAQK